MKEDEVVPGWLQCANSGHPDSDYWIRQALLIGGLSLAGDDTLSKLAKSTYI